MRVEPSAMMRKAVEPHKKVANNQQLYELILSN